MKRILLFLIIFGLVSFKGLLAQSISIVPAPAKLEIHKGEFKAPKILSVYISADFSEFSEATALLEAIESFTSMLPVKTAKGAKKGLQITRNNLLGSEAYELEINKKQIRIQAGGSAGVFYALQTLRQLRKNEFAWAHDGKPFQQRILGNLPCVKIQDQPAYAWRGMHLDVCRHFFSVDFIKKYLDLMAMHKMNVFHWHLTEDQGWRIEIKQYPNLTKTGAWRNGSMIGRYKDNVIDSIRYGGFYTQEQIKEVVEYARKRFINVLPEIEMPGHSLAALASYPNYSCTGGPFEVAKKWGGFEDVYCVGNDSTVQFLQNILDEVVPLFPFSYFHIGGDECEKTRWKSCPKCQKRMKDNGLKDENELQSWFIRTMETHLLSKRKILIGWDEILEGGLAPNAVVMSWRGTAGGIEAARQGHGVVMSPGKPCYFDHYQSKDSTEPIAIGGYNPVEDVFTYNPTPAELDATKRNKILGGQGNVWTEYINTPEQVEYMVFPRECALAEALWTASTTRNYEEFTERLKVHIPRLQAIDVNCATHAIKNK